MKRIKLVEILILVVLITNVIKPQWVQTNFSSKYSTQYILSYKNNLFVSAFERLVVDTGGVFRSSDLGTSWIRLSDALPAKYSNKIIGFENGGTDYILVASDSGLFCSTDYGDSWTEKNNNIGRKSIGNIDYIDGILFASIYQHTYRSIDLGDSWVEIFFGQSNRQTGALVEKDNYILAVMNEGTSNFLFKSLDEGLTWNSVGESGLYQSKQMVLVGENIYAGAATTLLKSSDSGLNWIGIPGLPPGYYYLNLKAYGDYLFCAHMTGIYFQHKDSTHWIYVSADIPPFLSCGEIDENYIYAARFDSLIWRRSISEILTGIDEQPAQPIEFKLEQNFPNPFNPSTTIRYNIPLDERRETKNVTLKIYDVLGNEIATLVNEEKPAGDYEVEFNQASGIKNPASGIYFYQLKVGEYLETKKMMLIK